MSERAAVEAAFATQIQALFKVLVGNLTTASYSDEEDEAAERFAHGLEIARKARRLALGEIDKMEKEGASA